MIKFFTISIKSLRSNDIFLANYQLADSIILFSQTIILQKIQNTYRASSKYQLILLYAVQQYHNLMENNSSSEYQINQGQAKTSRPTYSFISLELRQKLIDMVVQHGISIYRASKDLGIHNSTAKAIIRNFKRKGRIFSRKGEKTQKIRKEEKLSERKTQNSERKSEENNEVIQGRISEAPNGSTFINYWNFPIISPYSLLPFYHSASFTQQTAFPWPFYN